MSTESRAPFFIGVAGGSNSGKTTLAKELATKIGVDRMSLLQLDSYYRRWPESTFEERAGANYDHPDAFDWDLMTQHLHALGQGESVDVPVYDFADHNRSSTTNALQAGPVVIVEGILVLWHPGIRAQLDLKVFVDAPADLRLVRRLGRDVAERGRSHEGVISQYLETVRPSHELFVEPSKQYADVIIPKGGHNAPALEILRARAVELVERRHPTPS